MKISRKTINRLLKPFHLKVCLNERNDYYVIKDDNDRKICIDEYVGHMSYDSLFSCLQTCKCFKFKFGRILCNNPYYNCKSIEEMMIAKDLNENE